MTSLTYNLFLMDISFIPTVSAAGSVLDSSASYTASDIIRVAISLIVLVG